MSLSSIRLGVYGASGSGKTTFWRQLVLGNAVPVPPKSKLSQFLSNSADANGKSLPTTASIENIDLRIGKTTFRFADYPGGELSAAIKKVELESPGNFGRNLAVQQIIRSDALLFFFDPSNGNQPYDGHYAAELLRAKQLIDPAINMRCNLLLPIVFIIRQSEGEDCAKTEKWIDEVDTYLQQAYQRELSGYCPHALLRKEEVFHRINFSNGRECLGVLEKAQDLVELSKRFRRDDRRKAGRLILLFVFCLFLILFVPMLCMTSPTAQNLLLRLQEQAAPVFEKLPGLPISLVGEPSAVSEKAIELDPLFEKGRELDGKTLNSLNRSLFILMKRLNRLEDAGLEDSDEYKTRIDAWNQALGAVEKRFDDESDQSSREKLESFGSLLTALTDSPKRKTDSLDRVLSKFWQLYRQTLIGEYRENLSVHREAGTPPLRILEELCEKLESGFREVSESTVRGNAVWKISNEMNRKEQLKLDIKKALVACRNYADRYPVEIRIRSASYRSDQDIDRDFLYRLAFYGGQEKGVVYVDLEISTGIENSNSFAFIPSRKTLTVSFLPDFPLQLSLQRRKKGESAEWSNLIVWEIDSTEVEEESLSLGLLGVRFYLRYENEENTRYAPEGKGCFFDLDIRRSRIVPEFLWEIVSGNGQWATDQ